MSEDDTFRDEPVCRAADVGEWRAWLDEHHASVPAVWLVLDRSAPDALSMADAMGHALCFGWVDSLHVRRDGTSSYLRFTPRNPASTWSRVNRERVEELTRAGLMAPAGQALVDHARSTGLWDLLADAQEGVVPEDLAAAFTPAGRERFDAFPFSTRRATLEWITLAKRPETRARRIAETVDRSERGERPR